MMEAVERLLEKAFSDIKPYYIGIFVKGKVVASHYVKKSENLEDTFSRMVEYSIKVDDAIENFKPEFLFSDGKDFSIMIYYATHDIAVGIIYLGKSNFSLLKITAQDLAKELKRYENDLLIYYEEHFKTVKEQNASKEQNIEKQNDLDELEKVLTTQTNEIIAKESAESTIEEENTEKSDVVIPSLEDILSMETQDISTPVDTPKLSESSLSEINKILNEIEEEFIKIAGPFGKYIFRDRKNELLESGNITKSTISEFIQSLAEDMPEIEKRDLFLKNTKNLLNLYIL
jgi:hypothetical protein